MYVAQRTGERTPERPHPRPWRKASGLRRLTPGLLRVDRAAEDFDGLPGGVTAPGQVLAMLKAAAPNLGLSVRFVHAVDWLFKFTQPQDWGGTQRPIVWPSASLQQDAFGMSPTQVKALNRGLIEAGLVTMRDSPNGKRYGRRDHDGRIVEAYGFDLSPLAARYPEFLRLAEEAKAERVAMGRLRRRVTVARKAIAQILETATEYDFQGEEWVNLKSDTGKLVKRLREVERIEELTLGTESLERRQREGRKRLEMLLSVVAGEHSESVDSDPKGAENRPHIYLQNNAEFSKENTVVAPQGCNKQTATMASDPATPEQLAEQAETPPEKKPAQVDETVLQLSPDELIRMAPRLRTYLNTPRPVWPDVVNAADFLRSELDVSKSLWGEACIAMGREKAAIAVAIVSTKPASHFRSSSGGYFHGMVAKAKAGKLNLEQTIWGLRMRAKQAGRTQH